MASLLSGFGSSKPALTKKAAVSHARPKTFTASRARFDNGDIFVKEEPVHKVLPALDDPMGQIESTKGAGFDDFDDDMMDDMEFDEDFLKKEVDNLTIRDNIKPNFLAVNKNAPRHDLQNWKTAEAGMLDTFNQDDIKFDATQMDIFESNGHLKMWWYDAYERREKGYVYVFGKVLNKKTNKYVSCCVTVKNIERNLFVLPRKFELDGK